MGASPFGMAYGIGAGLSGVSQAYYKAQDDATNLAMKNLQLQNMQQAQHDDSDTRAIMSQPVTVNQDQTIGNPVYQRQVATDAAQTAANQASVSDLGDEGQGQQAPEYSTAPTAAPTQTIKAYTTPQQQVADEFRQRAQMLRSKGLWRSSLELDNVADVNEKEHARLAREGLQKSVLAGEYGEALNYLHGIGAKNALAVRRTNDGESIIITTADQNGTTHDVALSKAGYTQLLSGKDPSEIWRTDSSNYLRQYGMDQRQDQFNDTLEQRAQLAKDKEDAAMDRLVKNGEIKSALQRDFPKKTSMDIQKWEYKIASKMAMDKTTTYEQAKADVLNESSYQAKGAITDRVEYNVVSSEIKGLIKDGVPQKGDDNYAQYVDLRRRQNDFETKRHSPAPNPTPPPPGGGNANSLEAKRDRALGMVGGDPAKINRIWDMYKIEKAKENG